jgi:Bacterial conjugation TrbI-like protein
MQEHESDKNVQATVESDIDWDKASLAQLLGLNDETKLVEQATIDNEIITEGSTSNPITPQELFDDPQLGKTQPTFYSNPFAKFGAVGLVMLVVFGAGATVLNRIMSGKPKIAPTIANRETQLPKVEIADNPQETETGKLKAQLALGSQVEKIKSVERSKSPKTPATQRKVQPNKLIKRAAPRIADTEVRPVRASYHPRPIPQTSRYYPPRVAAVPRQQLLTNKVNTPNQPRQQQINQPNQQPITDPIEEWSKISRLGSYGSREIASSPQRDGRQAKDTTVDTALSEQTLTIPRATLVSAMNNQTVETPNYSDIEPLYLEEAAVISGEPMQELRVGASARGSLLTPLIWGKSPANNTSKKYPSTNGDKFIVQLTEALTTEDSLITLPKGSQIIATVVDIQGAGLVQLEATQVVIDGKEYVLPPGAISIRGNSGQPLMASKWGDKGGEIAARDAETFAVGSLAKVGKVLNQPKEEQISTNSGLGSINSFSSIRRSRSNILGAVLEGGFEPLTQQILQRNQQALQKIQQQEEVWYVKAGTNVQVFVNQSFQF